MPGIRLLARRGVAVVLSVIQNSLACPAPLTPTLRTLVLKSDRIAASVGQSVVIETKEMENGHNSPTFP